MPLKCKSHPVKQAILQQRTHQGFNECLGYLLMVDDNTVLHKDFALSRHFVVEMPDLNSCSTMECDSVAHIWRQAMQFLDDGWMLETNVLSDVFSSPMQKQSFPEPVSEMLDQERQLQFNNGHYFSTKVALSLTYKPKSQEAKQQRWFGFDNHGSKAQNQEFEKALQKFNQVINDFTGFLSQVFKVIKPLQGDDLVQYLHQCVTGQTQAMRLPSMGAFLDLTLSSEDFTAGIVPQIGKHWVQVLALDQLPQTSYPLILQSLSQFPLCYRWSTRFIPLGKNMAEMYLKRYQRHWSSKAIGFMGVIRESLGLPVKLDRDAQIVADDLDDLIVNNRSGQSGFGFYTNVIVLMHEHKTQLNAMAQAIKDCVQQCQFKVREERLNNTEAYLGSIPGHGDYNVRKILVDTDYLSHALPMSQRYQGEPLSPCPLAGYQNISSLLTCKTDGNRPFFLNLHVNDVGHSLILGPTGCGKSTLISLLMCGHRRYPNSRIVVFDKDFSQRLAVFSLGGDYITLGEVEEAKLSPLARCVPDDEYAIDVALQWLSNAMSLYHVEMTAKRQQLLREALQRLAHEQPQFKNLNHLHVEEPSLREALRALNSGFAKQVLNGTSNIFQQKDIVGIDCGALLQNNTLSAQTVSIIDALFNNLNEVFADLRPTLLILEEAWLYLKHPLFQAKLSDWLKTLRKANVAVLLVSQEIADIAGSPLQSTIQSACMTRIYCPNRAAKEAELTKHYQAFGLSTEEVTLISQMVPKRDYYYQSSAGSQIFQLDLGPLAKALLCQTDKSKRVQLEAALRSEKTDELIDWLSREDLATWADHLK